MLNFDRSTVKHGTQNIQNDCHQWLSDRFRLHQIRFRPGHHPGPHWGSIQRSPRPLAGLKGPTSKWRERERKGKGREEGDGRDRPPFCKFLDPPLSSVRTRRLGYLLSNVRKSEFSVLKVMTYLHS